MHDSSEEGEVGNSDTEEETSVNPRGLTAKLFKVFLKSEQLE